jgi:hypothetical protein
MHVNTRYSTRTAILAKKKTVLPDLCTYVDVDVLRTGDVPGTDTMGLSYTLLQFPLSYPYLHNNGSMYVLYWTALYMMLLSVDPVSKPTAYQSHAKSYPFFLPPFF